MDIPPKSLSLRVRQRQTDGGDEAHTALPAVQAAGELRTTPRSLPVLEAFRDFLAAERRRARRRMAILAGTFLTALVVLVCISVAVFIRLTSDFRGVRGEIETVKNDSLQIRNDTRIMLRALSEKTESLREDIVRERHFLTSAKTQDVPRIERYVSDLQEIRNLVAGLEQRSAALALSIEHIRFPDEPLGADLGIGETRFGPIEEPVDESTLLAPETSGPERQFVVVSIASTDGAPPQPWRLPLP